MTQPRQNRSRSEEWQRKLLIAVSGLLLFETLTGLCIFLLPFSVSNQVMVLLHTAVGLVFLVPFAWYQTRHWILYQAPRMSHVKLTGYFAMVATVIAIVSGLVLTVQALWATRISYAWDLIHIVATFALIVSILPHIFVLVNREVRATRNADGDSALAATKKFGLGSLVVAASLFVAVALVAYWYEPPRMENEFPVDYSYLYGQDRPFAPSLARTNTDKAFDARSMSGSESCGTARCHEQIVREWKVSAHRYSAMDVAFQTVQKVMAEQNGAESTRYCGGCHDPISLFSGAKNVFTEDLTNLAGYQEGVSCIVCHAIEETDVQGNANYVIRQPNRYMFELDEGNTARFFRDFLLRAYPRYHVKTLQHRLFKSPEFCAACHKQFIDEEINQVGWVQLQNQFDNWKNSRWNEPGDPTKTVECRECHMPLTESQDPANGDPLDYNRSGSDGKHRSHRFLAANQFMPLALELEGAEEHADLTARWLRGEIEIPEIADKWQTGPAVPLELVVPDSVSPGENVTVQAVVTNNKVGHDFPTGPLDIIQAWVEITVKDQAGNIVFESGTRDERHFIQPGSFIFKAEPVDQFGNLIDRHNLWEMVGVRYRRSMFPGASDRAEFGFSCPATTVSARGQGVDAPPSLDAAGDFKAPDQRATTLHVSAKLLYRKADQFLLNFLFGEDANLTAPITVMSEDEKTIVVRPRASS
ncbi:MAG: multiheme c-type cytochrome [Gemmatimonadota bacterium]|nr:multiheme c-type cytochrome [Gemmatimonadota bacterium]